MIIRTERLLLREFNQDDWRDTLKYQTNPQYLTYYPWDDRTDMDVREFIQKFVDWQGEKPRTKYQLAITFPEQQRVIGNCGIRIEKENFTCANIGYEISPDYWRKGFASEAAQAIVSYGFRDLKLHRIWALCLVDNLASWHVLEKIGMKREGRLRKTEFIKGFWRDSYIYAILEHEWKSKKSLTEAMSL